MSHDVPEINKYNNTNRNVYETIFFLLTTKLFSVTPR